ncbi:hypothetical protein C0216_08625 [Streptomyces globosus]|uniref:Uncharacterized protein n=1 Tax=Streptomyces globosus TaxID=68209 RepID=A0A344TXZ6_9ACTN|nr:hypothetical protein [Streptomyces globosus]AXE23517.1 hypothetical protein C0216_08625 [Streptomyces globosus]
MKGIPNTIAVVILTPQTEAILADIKRAARKEGVFVASERNESSGELRFAVVTDRKIRLRHLDYDEAGLQEMFPSRRPR